MEISPIKTESDYAVAMSRIEAVWGAAPGTPEGDELEVLVTLVEAYERRHYPIDLPDPVEAIKFRLEQDGKDYRALIGVIGQRTRVYEVMRRARPLSLNMIRRLHSQLEIPAEVLIQPTRKPARRTSRSMSTRSRSTARKAVNSQVVHNRR
jgi:HTH-type transcriptional regulator/antitoxin HigA